MDDTEKQEVVGETIVSIETGDTWMEIVMSNGRTISITARGGEVILSARVD